jgi:hypothetical protein
MNIGPWKESEIGATCVLQQTNKQTKANSIFQHPVA